MKQHKYYVSGMHCPACELLITQKVSDLENVHNVKCLTSTGILELETDNPNIDANYLDNLLRPSSFKISEKPFVLDKSQMVSTFISIIFIFLAILVFLGLHYSGALSQVRLDGNVAWWSIILFGLVAGFSTCAALVGGVLLALTKHWSATGVNNTLGKSKFIPQVMFNIGRIIGFAVFGAVLGLVGNAVHLSPIGSAWLVLGVAVIMIIFALQMLGVPFASRLSLAIPQPISKKISQSAQIKGRWIPFLVGALSFFLPCGFALTAQSYALMQGNPIASSVTMLLFAIGTLPALLIIGITSTTLVSNPKLSNVTLKLAGFIVLIFALYNINNQFNILGYPSLNSIGTTPSLAETIDTDPSQINSNKSDSQDESNYIPPKCACCSPKQDQQVTSTPAVPVPAKVKGQVQIIKMEASASGYTPNYFKVKQNLLVRWEITDIGTSGCTEAVIAPRLFSGEIELTKGKTAIKEFTPKQLGKFRFSCWMGMVTGTIEVVK